MNEAATETQSINTSGVPRKCVACGYNLTGLGEEPRCPECGLLNVPEALRQQVWELVDSGKWFFSPMFGPFQKRLPGWWWALDRPGDVKRSVKAAARNVAIAVVIVGCAALGSTAMTVEETNRYSAIDVNDPARKVLKEAVSIIRFRGPLGEFAQESRPDPIDFHSLSYNGRNVQTKILTTSTVEALWGVPRPALSQSLVAVACLVMGWAVPAFVGLCSQLRKGLPSFARAPRTIAAAANYESHRLVYTAFLFAILVPVESLARSRISFVGGASLTEYWVVCLVCLGILVSLAAAGWVGPVRSDYTEQLVRSRIHAARIVLMYGLAIPWFLLWFPPLAWCFIF